MTAINNHPTDACRLTALKKIELLFWDFIIRYLGTSQFLKKMMGTVFRLHSLVWLKYVLICTTAGIIIILSAFGLSMLFPASKTVIFPLFITNNIHTIPNQQNILIIHVSSTKSANPELISIWGLFLDQTNSTSLIFKPLYPRPVFDETSNRLVKSFSLTPQGKPAPLFLQTLEFDGIQWDKTIILDQQDILSVSARLSVMGARIQVSPPANNEVLNPILVEENALIKTWCSQITSSKNRADPFLFVPERLLQGSEYQGIKSTLEKINTSTESLRCKIVSPTK